MTITRSPPQPIAPWFEAQTEKDVICDFFREPDAMIWRSEHRDRMGEQESGPPDPAIEIVSPSNELHDTETKFKEYAPAGVAKYWIVNPKTQRISIHALEGREYKLLAHYGAGEKAKSAIFPGFEVAVDDLFAAE